MIFNVGEVDLGLVDIKKFSYDNTSIEEIDYIEKYEVVRNYLALQIKKDVNEQKNGVDMLDGEPIQMIDFVKNNGGKSVFTLSYVFINLSTGVFFYSTTIKVLEEIMKKVFKMTRKHLNFNTTYDDLKKITTIRILKTQSDDIFKNELDSINHDMRKELFSAMDASEIPKQEEYILHYAGGIFNLSNLEKLLAKYQNTSNIKLSVKGIDAKGNLININESILKKIEVETMKDFDNTYKKSLSEILREIEGKM